MARLVAQIAFSLMTLLLASSVTSAPSRTLEDDINAFISTLDCIQEVLPHAICKEPTAGWNERATTVDGLIALVSFALRDPACHDPIINPTDAHAQAEAAVNQCFHHMKDVVVDLRRVKARADKRAETSEAEETTKAAETTKATQTKGAPKTTLTAATTEPEPETTTTEAAKTTQPAATTSETTATTSTQATTQPTTTTSPSSTSSHATTSSASLSLKPSDCYTTSMQSITTCPVITTGAHSGRAGSCFPTTTPTAVCAKGLICRTDDDGNPSCMYAQNNLGTAGVVMAIFFAATVGVTASLIIIFCCREKRNHKRWAKVMEAEMIAREAAAAKLGKGPTLGVEEAGNGQVGGEDGRPLMGGGSHGYEQDPFRDDQRMR